MKLEHRNQQLDGRFTLNTCATMFNWADSVEKKMIHIMWNKSSNMVDLEIDGITIQLKPHQVITTTFYHQVKILTHPESLAIFSFNKPYYCIHDHDAEVSCNGIIFFGAQDLPVITLDETWQRKLGLLLEVFIDEFQNHDNIQGEMLLMLLKRLIILCTRLAKQQLELQKFNDQQVDTIRQFNFLVDQHFRTAKTVKEYADMLYKSPKTLSNLFKRANEKTPLQIIHERIILEARRLLVYTDKTANEIAYELGFEEPATFFKLFKKQLKTTPQKFRDQQKG